MPITTQKLNELSFVFPCYNEEESLPKLINQVMSVAPSVAENYEIVLVNDGSKDNTSKIAHEYAVKYPFIKVIDQANQGFGGALNTGLQNATSEWVFYTDADLQFDINELKTFIPFTATSDLVIGFRMKRAEGFKRWLFAKGMKVWNSVLLGFPWFIQDIDCAFKLMKKEVIKDVGPLMSKGNLVSTEFLFSAYRLGYKIHQLGVNHYVREFGVSKCGGMKDIVKVIKETFALRTKLINKSVLKPSLKPGLMFHF
jgi:glycosyltransferase involved in cell wall biosynthesis